jgi:hypothetical protein
MLYFGYVLSYIKVVYTQVYHTSTDDQNGSQLEI